MGCDIHGHLERRGKYGRNGWRGVADFNGLPRSYSTFARLAGVRDREGVSPVVPPRGFPTDVSWRTMYDYTLRVKPDEEMNGYQEGVTKQSKAEQWADRGISRWWDDTRITNPDWHTPSWLYMEELEIALPPGAPVEYRALLSAMREIEKSEGRESARFVFWFDN